MKRYYYIMTLASAILALASCKTDNEFIEAEGSLKLSVGVSDKVEVASRTLSEDEQAALGNDCKIRIYNGETLVRKYQGLENVPSEIALMTGDYSVRVTAGDSVAASFEERFFEGKEDFTIAKGEVSSVDVNCGIVNTVVAIIWDETLSDAFSACQVTVTSATGELVYTSENADAKGYFILPEDNKSLTFKFSGTTLTGGKYEKTDVKSDLNASTLYNLTYSYKPFEQDPTGGASLQVTVDETPLEEDEHVITFKQRPVIVCKDAEETTYNLEQPMYLELNAQKDFYLNISTSSSLSSLIIRNENFTTWGCDYNQFDMLQLGAYAETLKTFGISVVGKKPALNGDVTTILFAKELVAKMTASEGSYSTTIEATDANGKNRIVVWNIIASNATVVTDEIIPYEVWTSKATLHGSVTGTLASTAKFRYRAKNTADWTTVDADVSGDSFSKEITGLTPGTTYEYQAMDGEQASSITYEFTTEAEFQPENTGFEYTSGTSPILIYGDGQSMWWDTGNHGSATLKVNITTPDTSIKHSGNQSLLLSSKKPSFMGIGKFAAGNVFAGKYLKTDGTDGVLGWGRPCTSRPKALKVWVRYEPGTVDEGGDHISDGATDEGIIYIALGDWAGMEAEGETWPFVVRTKNQASLFSKEKGTYSGDGIIAYGEKVFTEAYKDGENLKELTIELDYDSFGGYQRKPTSIIIVSSASKYGDYFQGSTTSKMWLDDIELIYE